MKVDHEMETILDEFAARLEEERVLREASRRADAPDFNAFDSLRPKENALSQMLGTLLDPRGNHGQGATFLDLFIQEFGIAEMAHTDFARVSFESRTFALDAARRMDIEITGRSWVLAIENKPVAVDQPRQIADYLQHLRRRGGTAIRLLYLTSDGRRPSPASIGARECTDAIKRGELHPVSYAQVVTWLEKCRPACASPKVAWYLDSLSNYLRRSVLGNLPRREENMIYKTLLDSGDASRISTVLHLLQAKDAIRSEFRRRLMADITKRLPRGWEILDEIQQYDLLEMQRTNHPGWTFAIELERAVDPPRWFYGIAYAAKSSAKRRRIVERAGAAVAKRLAQSGAPTKYWAYWRWFEGADEHEPREYDNWDASVQPWLDMADGTMATHFLALATQLGKMMETEMAKLERAVR